MKKIVTIYHSGYGHTKKTAEAVHAGVKAAGGASELIAIDAQGEITEENWHSLTAADAIIFGSPTYMGSVSWQFKKFADASSKPWFTQAWKNKIAAGFTNSASINGDKHSTIHYLFTLSQQHAMIWTGLDLLPANKKASQRNDINYLAGFAGLISQAPADASPEEGPPAGDLETAQLFGKRIVEVANKFNS